MVAYVIIAIFVGVLAFGVIDLIWTEIVSTIELVRDHRFHKKYYLDHVEMVETDGEFPALVGVYKERA